MGTGKEEPGGGGVLRTLSRTSKSRNNAAVTEIMCLRFTEIFDVKGQCMAGPVYNATVCGLNDSYQ